MARYYGLQDRSGHKQTGPQELVAKVAVLSTGEKDTGFDFQAGDVIEDVFVRIYTEEATATTKTIDVGLLSSESGGDVDGFLDGVVTSAAGMVKGESAITTGSNTKFVAATPTLGPLLLDHQAGTDVDQDEGVAYKKHHIIAAAVSLVYQLGSAHTELDADIHVRFYRPAAA